MALITADLRRRRGAPFLRAESMRPMAAEIEAAVPLGEPVAVLRPGFLPFLYYLRPGLVYVQTSATCPPSVHYLLVRQDDLHPSQPPCASAHADSTVFPCASRTSGSRTIRAAGGCSCG